MSYSNDKLYQIDNVFLEKPALFGDTFLFQLGRLHCSPNYVVEEHAHRNWYELTIVTEGEGEITTNGVSLPVKKGDIYLSFPADFHSIVSSAHKPLKYDYFSFYTMDKELEEALKNITLSLVSYEYRIFQNERILSMVVEAIAEISEKKKYYEQILTSLFHQILLTLLRNYHSIKPPQLKHVTVTEKTCFQIMHYIDTHLYDLENLTSLTSVFNYNYTYLSDKYKQVTGDTLFHYYQTRRLETAKLLLQEGKLKIVEISELLHYASPFSFSKAFKAKYGVSPKNYTNAKQAE